LIMLPTPSFVSSSVSLRSSSLFFEGCPAAPLDTIIFFSATFVIQQA
jgi:hypothetical protein